MKTALYQWIKKESNEDSWNEAVTVPSFTIVYSK